MSERTNAEMGWKIAFIVLLTAVVAVGATYLVLEARRPVPGVTQTPAEPKPQVTAETPTEGDVEGTTVADSDDGEIPLPTLSGNDLLSRIDPSASDAPEGAETDGSGVDSAGTYPAETPESPAPPGSPANPGVQAARDALSRGEFHRSVLLLDELENSPQWSESGEIKVLEEDILMTLEMAEAGLSSAQRQAIQGALARLGHDPGGVDGVFGTGTRRAIRAYQNARSQRPTGYLTEVQLQQLLGEANAQQQVLQAQQQARVIELRGEAESLLQAGDLYTSLQRVEEGLQVVPDNPELMALQENLQRRLAETDLDLSQQERQRVQLTLQQLGYNVREQEGLFGQTTRAAIAAYQRSIGQPSTGYLTESALQQLLRDAGEAEQSAAIQAQEQLGVLVNATRDLLARSDPYQDGVLLQEQLNQVVGAQDRHPRNQELLGLELALRARLEEVGLGLSDADRRAIQTDLSRLGFDTRGVDGHLGPGTREAVSAYQRSRGLPTTGYLSRPMLNQLWQDAQNLPTAAVDNTAESAGTGSKESTTGTSESASVDSKPDGSGTRETLTVPADNPRALLEMMDRGLRELQQQVPSAEGKPTAPSAAEGQQGQDQPTAGRAKGS